MRLTVAFAGIAALAICAVSPADAGPRQKRVERFAPGQTVIITRDESGRTRTKILVQKRSYLDAGTEVMPGELGSLNYIALPTDKPGSAAIGSTIAAFPLQPVPGPWYVPGNRNPWPWFAP